MFLTLVFDFTGGNIYRPVHVAVIGISTVIISVLLLSAAAVLFCGTGGGVPSVVSYTNYKSLQLTFT